MLSFRPTSSGLAVIALPFLLLMAGCASPDGTTPAADRPDPLEDPRVGAEVDRICFASSISGFSAWDGEDGLILNRGPREKFLVTMLGACLPLDGAMRVGLDDRFGGGCLRRGDSLFISSSLIDSPSSDPFASGRCRIDRIYEWVEDSGAPATAPEDAVAADPAAGGGTR